MKRYVKKTCLLSTQHILLIPAINMCILKANTDVSNVLFLRNVLHLCKYELTFPVQFCFTGDISTNAEWRLMKELLRRYESRQSLRAVTSPSEAVNITLSIKMVQIIELVRY